MIGVTFFGLLLTPVFYVTIRTLAIRFGKKPPARQAVVAPLTQRPW